jgi:CAAX protease family protein
MRPVRAVGLYLLLVFFGGALLAPWIYHLVQHAAEFWPGLQNVATRPFPRYVNRALLILGLAGLWPFLRAVQMDSWRALGLSRRPDSLTRIKWGFIVGFVSLASIVLIALAFGARQPSRNHDAVLLLTSLLKAGLAAAIVAPLEEIFFRGALFGALRQALPWTLALVVGSMLYALLHFLEKAGATGPVGWNSGLGVLWGMVAGFGSLDKLIPGFLNLTLVGIILGLAYQRSGSLHFSIGLHAGWIFWLKTYGSVTTQTADSRAWLFGTSKLINGWLAFAILGMVLVLLSRTMPQKDSDAGWQQKSLFS